jgi:Mn2+/Fe2+ NRAMP family transporter
MQNVPPKTSGGWRWVGSAATVSGTVLALELIGLISRPLGWVVAGAALVIIFVILAQGRK